MHPDRIRFFPGRALAAPSAGHASLDWLLEIAAVPEVPRTPPKPQTKGLKRMLSNKGRR